MQPGSRDQGSKGIFLEEKRIGYRRRQLSKDIDAAEPFDIGRLQNRIYNALVSHDFRPEIKSWSIAYVSNCRRV
jgi:hypothetical protein